MPKSTHTGECRYCKRRLKLRWDDEDLFLLPHHVTVTKQVHMIGETIDFKGQCPGAMTPPLRESVEKIDRAA